MSADRRSSSRDQARRRAARHGASRSWRGSASGPWSGVVLIACIGPFFAPYAPEATRRRLVRARRARDHPLGLDYLGRDVLSRFLWGGRTALVLAVLVTIAAIAIGLDDRPRRGLPCAAGSTTPDARRATSCWRSRASILDPAPGRDRLRLAVSRYVIVAVALANAPRIDAHRRGRGADDRRARLRRGRRGRAASALSTSWCGRCCRTSSRPSSSTSAFASRSSILLVASVSFLGLRPAAARGRLGSDGQREPRRHHDSAVVGRSADRRARTSHDR